MSVNIVNDAGNPTACSGSDIACTFDIGALGITGEPFTIDADQSNGTYIVDGPKLGNYADGSTSSLIIDTVRCEITKAGTTWESHDDTKIDFKCQNAECNGNSCEKTLQSASSYEDCSSACSTNAECTNDDGVITEVQP